MDTQTIGVIIASVLGIIGAVGGVPQLIKWAAPKPHLKLILANIKPLSDDPALRDDKQVLHFTVENVRKSSGRNADATEVNVVFHVIDKDGSQCGEGFTCLASHSLADGEKITREYPITPETLLVKPAGNPHTLVFKVTCKEREIAKSRMSYDFPVDLEARAKYQRIVTSA